MDCKIEVLNCKKIWIVIVVVGVVVVVIVYGVLLVVSISLVNVDWGKLIISQVKIGVFVEYFLLCGQVMLVDIIYFDIEEGGWVDVVYIKEGNLVKVGDLILILINNQLQLDVIMCEVQISEQFNNLCNIQLVFEQNCLLFKQQFVQLDYWLVEMKLMLE